MQKNSSMERRFPKLEGGVLQQTNRENGRLRVLIPLTVAPASATIIHIGLLLFVALYGITQGKDEYPFVAE